MLPHGDVARSNPAAGHFQTVLQQSPTEIMAGFATQQQSESRPCRPQRPRGTHKAAENWDDF